MDIFFQDPSEIPLPPNEVRIRQLRAEPWPDNRRINIYLEVDPSQKRPNADVIVLDAEENPVAEASVIESMTRKMEFTLHLRLEKPAGTYTVHAALYFTDPIPEPVEGETEPPSLPEPLVVDHAETTFTIPESK